jgi:hypothetical protein
MFSLCCVIQRLAVTLQHKFTSGPKKGKTKQTRLRNVSRRIHILTSSSNLGHVNQDNSARRKKVSGSGEKIAQSVCESVCDMQ